MDQGHQSFVFWVFCLICYAYLMRVEGAKRHSGLELLRRFRWRRLHLTAGWVPHLESIPAARAGLMLARTGLISDFWSPGPRYSLGPGPRPPDF